MRFVNSFIAEGFFRLEDKLRKVSSEERDWSNNQTTNKKHTKTEKPEILCRNDITPVIGRLILNIFRLTGRPSLFFTLFLNREAH